jgi:glycosyltransferase involved in cell wall biosynthesis
MVVPMRIGFDAFPAMNSFGGVGNYSRCLLEGLASLPAEGEIIAYIPNRPGLKIDLLPTNDKIHVTWRETSEIFKNWYGGGMDLDLFHGTNFKAQAKGRFGSIITIHDLWLDRCPQYSKKLFGQKLSFYRTRYRAKHASHVITVSHHSAKEIQELYGIDGKQISVIWNGVSKEFWPEKLEKSGEILQSRFGIDGPYILFVGGAEPRKNHRALFRAYTKHSSLQRTHCLVVIGNPNHWMGTIEQTSKDLGILHRVVSLQNLSINDMRSLYSHADLFVFPSFYEGFGFPVLEAMACGVPVITSKGTALQEISNSAAVLVDPHNDEELGCAMQHVIEDQEVRRTLRRKGIERAKTFTWERAAEQTWQVYAQICQ